MTIDRLAARARTLGSALVLAFTTLSASAQTAAPGFHFQSICRTDPTVSKNAVTVVLHGPDVRYGDGIGWMQVHNPPLAGATINALWTYVDYRQNRAVFKYRLDSCVTDARGACTFHGGSGRARWQLSEVVGYEMSSPAFEVGVATTATCPNTTMIDFW
jgi:hypothetical protein